MPARKLTDEQELEIVNCYTNLKQSRHKIATIFDLTAKRVNAVLEKHKVEIKYNLRPKAVLCDEDIKTIVNLYINTTNESIYSLARKYHTSQERIRDIILTAGYKTKEPNDNRRVILTKEQEQEIYNLIVTGTKIYDICDHLTFKCNSRIVKRYVKKFFPSTGRTPYLEAWKTRLLPEIFEAKVKEVKDKISASNSGENSGKWGKPPCKKCSSGLHGWYKKDHHFRSIKELSYILLMEKQGIGWRSGEGKESCIPYIDFEGKPKNYWPDFYTDDGRIIEIKPTALHSAVNVKLKAEAAMKYCAENELKYELIDHKPDLEAIKLLLDSGEIEFAKNCKERFLLYYEKNIKPQSSQI